MQKILLSAILFLPITALTQVIELNVQVKYLAEKMEVQYMNIDTSYFEFYWHCSQDNGFQLKESLPDGFYKVYYNDTLMYSTIYLNNKQNKIW
ncbi:MAG: hypothetical protein ACPG4Z_08315, partial [Chitinophagales bacterium]